MKDHLNSTPTNTSCRTTFSETDALHGILTECGVHRIWEHPDMMLIEHYIRHRVEDEHMHKTIGVKVFNHFLRQVKRSEPFWPMTVQDELLFWFLRFADGFDLKKALYKTLDSEPQIEPIDLSYGETHASFERDYDQFNKLTTLMVIEGFPIELGLLPADAIARLTLHDSWVGKYGVAQVLQKLEKSIKTSEQTYMKGMLRHRFNVDTVKGKTTCAQKYLELGSIDRIRLMRYYQFVCSENAKALS